MRKAIFFAAFAVFAFFAIQASAATITGTVTTPDGGALPSVTVKAYTSENPLSETHGEASVGDDGSYSLTVEDGTYYIFAMPDPDADYSFNATGEAISISGTETTTEDLLLTTTQVRGVLYYPDGVTGAAGVRVEAHTGDGTIYRAMLTNEEGKFNLGGLVTDIGLGLEFADSYLFSGAGYDTPIGYDFTLREGDKILELEFSLISAPKTIDFTVLYPDGTGVEAANVGVYPVGGLMRHADGCRTGSDGTCSTDISGGEWLIDVNPEYNNPDIDWAYFEPGLKISFAEDETVESASYEFTVVKTDAWVQGILLNHDGSIPLTSDIHVVNKEGNGIWGKINNDTGAFNFPVVAGVLVVRAFPLNEQSDDAFPVNEIVVTPGETYDLGTIYGLNPTSTISGYLLTSAGEPIPGKDVTAWDFNNDYHTQAATDSSGSFSLSVYQSTWVLSVEGDADYELVNDVTVEITSDNEVSADHVLEMKKRGKTISGSLLNKDGNLVEGENFTPYAIDSQGRVYAGEVTSGNNYSLKVPANDTYEVYLFFDSDSEYLIADKLMVTVEGEDAADQNFTILHDTATISGELQDANGNAVGLRTRIIATNHFGVRTTETNEYTGQYELSLPKGEWQVSYEILEETNDYLRQPGEVTEFSLQANEEETHNITLVETPYTVSGTVTDVDDAVLPYTEVYLEGDSYQLFTTADENGNFSFQVPAGDYELGAGNHLQSDNIAPTAETITVADDVTGQTLVFAEAALTLSGEVNRDSGYVRAYSDSGHSYLGEITDGEYSLNVAEGDTLTIEAFSLGREKFYRNIPEEVTMTDDQEVNLVLYEDPGVDVPTSQIISFDGSQPQILGINEDVIIEVPAYALSDNNVVLMATPSLEVKAHDYDAPINFSFELSAKEASGEIITKFNQPIVINMGWEKRELETFGIKEKDLQPRFAEEISGLLENTGAAILDKENNQAVFVSDHFSKFTLATPTSLDYKVLKTSGLHPLKKKAKQVTLKWSKVFGAKKYQIKYRKVGAKKWQLIKTKKSRKVIKALAAGTKYQFKVRALRGQQKGEWSKVLQIKTKV